MRTLAAVLALSLALPALAAEVAGVKVPDSTTVGGKTLVLNGAGLRTKVFFKVYVIALYLEARSSDPVAIVAADAPWKASLTLKREADKKAILGGFKDGFENNSRADLPKLLSALDRVDAIMKDLKTGDVVEFAYLPGTGCTVTASGGGTVTIEGKTFADGMLRIWLGDKPAQDSLKSELLGK
jgi:hypothetical protein